MAAGTVVSQVDYLQRIPLYKKEKPFQLFVPVDENAPDQRTTNLQFEPKERVFHDIRGHIEDFKLDSHGIQVKRQATTLDMSSFQNPALVESIYFDEVKTVLEGIEGGYDRAYIFDWRLRDSATPRDDNEFDMNDLTTWLRPSPTVHIDQSPRAVLHRILLHLPDEAARLLQGRVRIINVWRPLGHPVEDYPLAFCEPGSVPNGDLVECDHVRRKFKGSNYYVYFSEAHRWNYLGNHQPDEILLLKMFDSDPSVKSKYIPHASFLHPAATANSKPRKSVEVRVLVFNDPQE